MGGRGGALARAVVVGALVSALVLGSGACGAPEQAGSATNGGASGGRPAPTEPPEDAFTRPLAPGATVVLHANLIVVGRGESAAERQADVGVLRSASSLAVGADGSVYVGDHERGRIVRFGPDGTATLVAGTDGGVSPGDGGPAVEARIRPYAVAIAPDATVWLSDDVGLRHIDGSGVITTVVPYRFGGAVPGPDVLAGTVATGQDIVGVRALAVGADGRPLLGIGPAAYRLEADLTLTHLAGRSSEEPGDGGPATAAGFEEVSRIVSRPDGSLLLLDQHAGLVREVSPSGTITTLGGTVPRTIDVGVGPFGASLDGVAAGPDGSAIVTMTRTGEVLRMTPDATAVITDAISLPGAVATFADGTVVVAGASGALTRVGV